MSCPLLPYGSLRPGVCARSRAGSGTEWGTESASPQSRSPPACHHAKFAGQCPSTGTAGSGPLGGKSRWGIEPVFSVTEGRSSKFQAPWSIHGCGALDLNPRPGSSHNLGRGFKVAFQSSILQKTHEFTEPVQFALLEGSATGSSGSFSRPYLPNRPRQSAIRLVLP